MYAEIVMIGTELLLGELVDTNANRLAKALREIGKWGRPRTTCLKNRLNY
jgi:molybdopterin-biosynthesis enzyme MoeA-like protein